MNDSAFSARCPGDDPAPCEVCQIISAHADAESEERFPHGYRTLADVHRPAQTGLMLEAELNNLRRVVAEGGSASEIDDALLPLIARSEPSIIAPILVLLNESGDQDGMWSILHTAESFDGPVYMAGLLTALPVLMQSCPWWATTLVIRVLNSDTNKAELIAQLRHAPPPTKGAAAKICEPLSNDARFQAKAAPVLAAATV